MLYDLVKKNFSIILSNNFFSLEYYLYKFLNLILSTKSL